MFCGLDLAGGGRGGAGGGGGEAGGGGGARTSTLCLKSDLTFVHYIVLAQAHA